MKIQKIQPSDAGDTCSPPAMPPRLKNPKWPLGVPKMADLSVKVSTRNFFCAPVNLR